MNWTIINLIIWPMVAGFFFFNWLVERNQVKKWRRLENNQSKRNFELQAQIDQHLDRPMFTVSADVATTITELQNENAQLRGDVETGCRLIDRQREKLNEQTKLLNKLVTENRRFVGQLGGLKFGKR